MLEALSIHLATRIGSLSAIDLLTYVFAAIGAYVTCLFLIALTYAVFATVRNTLKTGYCRSLQPIAATKSGFRTSDTPENAVGQISGLADASDWEGK